MKQGHKKLVQISKAVGKGVLGLLLFLLVLLALLHTPFAQRHITRFAEGYLSSRINSKVEIGRITFSIGGSATVHDLSLWDPENEKILSAQKIEVQTSILDLIDGEFNFGLVALTGVDGRLREDQNGLNIQFLLDAFGSDEEATTNPTAVVLQLRKVELREISFEYVSASIRLTTDIDELIAEGLEYTTIPANLVANGIELNNSNVSILTTTATESDHPDSKANSFLLPGFDIGITFDVNHLSFVNNSFSLHHEKQIESHKFDPSHLDLTNLNLVASQLSLLENALAAKLESLSGRLPGFNLAETQTNLKWDSAGFHVSDLHAGFANSKVDANFHAEYVSDSLTIRHLSSMLIDMEATIDPADVVYFLDDSVANAIRQWGPTKLLVDANSSDERGEITRLEIHSRDSRLSASANLTGSLDPDKIRWDGLIADARLGPNVLKTISTYIPGINFPPDLSINFRSNGVLDKFRIESVAHSLWGEARISGTVGVLPKRTNFDIKISTQEFNIGKWIDIPWIGPGSLEATANGTAGASLNVILNGRISEVNIFETGLRNISVHGIADSHESRINTRIEDPDYRADVVTVLQPGTPLIVRNDVQLQNFRIGELFKFDSTLSISGHFVSEVKTEADALSLLLAGDNLFLKNAGVDYPIDTLQLHAEIAPKASTVRYAADPDVVNISANFDLFNSPELFRQWYGEILDPSKKPFRTTGTHQLKFDLLFKDPRLFQLFGIGLDNFRSLSAEGDFNEESHHSSFTARAIDLSAYGVSLDSLHANMATRPDSGYIHLGVQRLGYDSAVFGNLSFDIANANDTAIANLQVINDTLTVLALRTRINRTDSGALLYPQKLHVARYDYSIDPENPVLISKENARFSNFVVKRKNTEIGLDGDLNAFDVTLRNLDVTPVNYFLPGDTTIVNSGSLNGSVSYHGTQKLDLNMTIDSLGIYNSSPFTLKANAESGDDHLPFTFSLVNESNKIDLGGDYQKNGNIDAMLAVDVNDLKLFSFLTSSVLDRISGKLQGHSRIHGSLQEPVFDGYLEMSDVTLTTLNPKLDFNISKDRVELAGGFLNFNNFTLYDSKHNPLSIDGKVGSRDYQSYEYDFHIVSDNYTLIDHPDSIGSKVQGILVVDSDITVKGNDKDTDIKARIAIDEATKLTLVTSEDEIELLAAEGIIDFVEPAQFSDTTSLAESMSLYDSLVASLPKFDLSSTISVAEDALIRVVMDPQSGDYIETSGSAALELDYDRTGNLSLAGNYTIKDGVYRLSFYDLVKKNFKLVQGSSINWSGSPENGELNIRAVHTVESNSLGLIGHEIGENEKSIYKRSLDYEVGINIRGTMEEPIVSFSLDLPKNERTNYPVLSSKLDRLQLPEYETELNKQVFGLLVLGGFIPESSGSDINSNVIATTALSNSVNSLLASQLNRFASQYIKGVNIDFGIQSFSDYSAPGGKTQTAMDFRVSKSVLNDRLSFEIGGDFDISQDQSGANTGSKNYRGDIAIIYDLTGNGDKQLKLFNNETYDIIYQEIRNTGISLIFIREFNSQDKNKNRQKNK